MSLSRDGRDSADSDGEDGEQEDSTPNESKDDEKELAGAQSSTSMVLWTSSLLWS